MLTIGSVHAADLATTAALHREHLALGLFPRLGDQFLRQYHASFIESPYGIALAARDRGRLAGVLFGTTSNPDHYRWTLRNHGWTLAWRGGLALLTRPMLAWTFAKTRLGRYASGINRCLTPPQPGPARAQGPPVAVLNHIVTDVGDRGRGVGRRLVDELKKRARASGIERIRLVTPAGGPGRPFFERLGAERIADRRETDGKLIHEYHFRLDHGVRPMPVPAAIQRHEPVRAQRARQGALANARRPLVGNPR